MPIRPQSCLGQTQSENRKDIDMGGILLVGKVIRVHNGQHTADVEIINNQFGTLSGSTSTEGKYACKILESLAGFDPNSNKAFGTISPIQVGCTVLVGFINNYKSQPVIIGCLHSTNESQNILPTQYPYPIEDERVKYEKLHVTKNQDYALFNGRGEFEIVNHSKSYITTSESSLDDSRDGFDWSCLQITDKKSDDPIGISEDHFRPLDILAVLQDKFDHIKSGFLKFFISAKNGVFRISKDKRDDTLFFLELSHGNTFKVKHQFDTYKRDESKDYIEIRMDAENNTIEINQVFHNSHNKISLNKELGITIDSTQHINISSKSNITVNSESQISLQGKNISIEMEDMI